MASHGSARHLKRQNLSVRTGLPRKGSLWVKKTSAGKHSARESMPLLLLLRDKLSLAETSRQAKKLLSAGDVLIDGFRASALDAPVGLMDLISISKLSKTWRLVVEKGKMQAKEVSGDKASKVKYCRIIGKTLVGKGKVQLNLHDSRNLIIEKEEDRFKVGDTILVSVPKQELKGFLKMEKGAECLVFKGRHAGKVGTLQEILDREGSKPADARLSSDGKELVTLKDYLFVIDKDYS